MEPLQAIAMPTQAVVVVIDTANSWQSGTSARPVRLAYIATDSTERVSFVSLQSAPQPANVLRILTRPSHFNDMPHGLVIELHLAQDLADGEVVHLSLAHAGATTYYPPQQIDDVN